jgi:hypothetical protein
MSYLCFEEMNTSQRKCASNLGYVSDHPVQDSSSNPDMNLAWFSNQMEVPEFKFQMPRQNTYSILEEQLEPSLDVLMVALSRRKLHGMINLPAPSSWKLMQSFWLERLAFNALFWRLTHKY